MFRWLFIISLFPFFSHALPQRIISLSPHTTELAFEAGLGDKLVAVSEHSDYPKAALTLERVADYKGINLERVVALKPDLVLAWKGGNPENQLEKLKQFGIKIFYSNPHSLSDAADNIEHLGLWSQNPAKAQQKANLLRQRLANLAEANKEKDKIPYFYQLDSSPLMTNNGNHWPQPLFSLCGGINIFADSKIPYPQVNIEQVIIRAPELIFFSSIKSTSRVTWINWKDHIPAVKNDAFFVINSDWLNRPSPRSLMAIEQICAAFDKVREKMAIAKTN